MGLWPVWRCLEDGARYRIMAYAGLMPDNKPVIVFESLDGYLNECVRYQDLNTLFEPDYTYRETAIEKEPDE